MLHEEAGLADKLIRSARDDNRRSLAPIIKVGCVVVVVFRSIVFDDETVFQNVVEACLDVGYPGLGLCDPSTL